MVIKVYRSGVTSLYIGTPQFRPNLDKWWRLNMPVAGPVDTFGERLLPSTTAIKTFAKNYAAGTILTYGGEESPAFQADKGYVGGNHAIPGSTLKSIFNYSLMIVLDGHVIPPAIRWLTGSTLVVTERYYVRQVVNGPAIVEITLTRTFTSAHQLTFAYKARVLSPFSLFWVSGLQSQKPNMKAGQTLWLRIPGAISPYGDAGGTNITALNTLTNFGPATWAGGNPPIRFERFVKQGGSPLFTVVQGFASGQPRGETDDAYMYSPARKSYPKGLVYPTGKAMVAGDRYQVNGYYGCYNGH